MSSPRMQVKSENDDRLNRVKNFGAKGKSPPIIQPKPNRRMVQVKPSSSTESSSSAVQQNGQKTADMDFEDPGDIRLDPESLAQFGSLDAAALDAVKRYHILDSAAQRQKAHLSHGKGLQNRRLPSQFAGKVGDDYQDQRKGFDPLMASNLTAIPEDGGRSHDQSGADDSTSSLNDEQREQHIMQKVGVAHGSAIAGLAALFKKSPVGGRMPRSTSGSVGTPPLTRAKPRKTSTPESPSVTSLKKSDSNTSPRSSFKFKLRRKKGRMSRESSSEDVRGSSEDLRSETSSICSVSKLSIKEEDILASPKKEASPKSRSDETLQSSPRSSPMKIPSKPAAAQALLDRHESPGVRGSLVFKEPVDVPALFEEKTSLFDAGELDNILTKSTTVFKEDSSEEKPKKMSPLSRRQKGGDASPKMVDLKKITLKPTKKPTVDLSLYEKKSSPSLAGSDSPKTSAKQRIALFEQGPKPTTAWGKDKKAALNSPIKKSGSPPEPKQPLSAAKDKKASLDSPIKKKISPPEQKKPTGLAQLEDKTKSKTPPAVKENKENGTREPSTTLVKEEEKGEKPSGAVKEEPTEAAKVSPPVKEERKDEKAAAELKEEPTEAAKVSPLAKEEREGEEVSRAVKQEPTKPAKLSEEVKVEKKEEVKIEKKEEEKANVVEKEEEKPEPAKEEKKIKEEKSVAKESPKLGKGTTKESSSVDEQPSWKALLEERQRKRRELLSEKKEKDIPKPTGSNLFSDTTSAAKDAPAKQSAKEEPKPSSDIASMKASLLDDELFQDEEPTKDQKASLLDDEAVEPEPALKEQKSSEEELASVPSSDDSAEKVKDEPHSPLPSKHEQEEPKEQAKEEEEKSVEKKKADSAALFGSDNEQFASKILGSPKMGREETKTEAKRTETKKSSLSQPSSKDKKEADTVEVAVDPLGVVEEGTSFGKKHEEKQKEEEDTTKTTDDDILGKDDSTGSVSDKAQKKEDKEEEKAAPVEEPPPATKSTSKAAKTKVELSKTKGDNGKPSRLHTLEDKKTRGTSPTEKALPRSPLRTSNSEADEKPHWKKMLEERRKAREQAAGTTANRSSPVSTSEQKAKERSPVLKVKTAPAKDINKPSQAANGKYKPPPLKSVSRNDGDKKTGKSSAEPSSGKEGVGSKETTSSTTPTLLIEQADRKSPGFRETSPRHVTPPTDSTIPKWKQELLARKRSDTTSPLSPKKTSAEALEKKEEKIPAWKQELLAKRKKQSESPASGMSTRSSTVSVPGRDGSRSRQDPKQVPSFMKEFQAKKRMT